MDLQNFFTATIIILTIDRILSIDPKYEACAPYACGNGPNISYPFWVSHEQEPCCGFPNFEITCNEKNPVLNISNGDYIIRDIFYANHSFVVANAAVYEEDSCPAPMFNFTIDRTPFHYSPDPIDLFFLYNCTSEPVDYTKFPVDCASNATHHSFAGFHKELLEYKNFSFESCQSLVNAPVNVDVDFERLLQMSYIDILKMGFVLSWTANNCSNCERSGGRCGFDNNEFICFCHDRPHLKACDDGERKWRLTSVIVAVAIASPILLLCIVFLCFRRKLSSSTTVEFWKKRSENDQNLEDFIRNHESLPLKRYTFSSIKKITNTFRDKLGQGGYGGVYKGKLPDGKLVAVKVLNASKGNGEEFINEVASISRTFHVNIVTLLGFCLEPHKRAVIYEFMPNGSLEKFICKDNSLKPDSHLGWKKLYQIAIGIARGLEYLHRGCNTRILHFDIKPHNILLDEDFCPKISDFGLAKLCPGKESVISMLGARGTIGYIAPEVFSRNFGRVSHKSDVYSFGMMVLEMVGATEKINFRESDSSEMYFPQWVYKHLEMSEDTGLQGVMSMEESDIVRKMILVGLWCIQTIPSNRPSMSKVIEMLEGSLEALQIPPKPFPSSPPRLPPQISATSGSTS